VSVLLREFDEGERVLAGSVDDEQCHLAVTDVEQLRSLHPRPELRSTRLAASAEVTEHQDTLAAESSRNSSASQAQESG
jgi:hypothetical protein